MEKSNRYFQVDSRRETHEAQPHTNTINNQVMLRRGEIILPKEEYTNLIFNIKSPALNLYIQI